MDKVNLHTLNRHTTECLANGWLHFSNPIGYQGRRYMYATVLMPIEITSFFSCPQSTRSSSRPHKGIRRTYFLMKVQVLCTSYTLVSMTLVR